MQSTQHPALPALLLNLLPSVGIHRYWGLVDHFGSPEAVLQAPASDISILSTSAKTLLTEYQLNDNGSRLMQQALGILDKTKRQQAILLSVESDDYPALLKNIHHPPPLLYIKGDMHNLCLPQLAMVGSRHATHSGLENTRLFASHLCQHGFIITSGLALGIDSAAHQATLNQKGKTIAVMATGIDAVYPKRHQYLADQMIAEGSTLITEFHPSTPPKADHFPRRNRIISGLSLGVIVVEAAIKSGSLITAHYALEQGREVFAIPSSIHNPQSKGCHQLIKQGATLVESSQDIVEHLQGGLGHIASMSAQYKPSPSTTTDPIITQSLTNNEKLIMAHIGFEPTSIDQLIQSSQLSIQSISASLSHLEVNGLIKQSDWGYERV